MSRPSRHAIAAAALIAAALVLSGCGRKAGLDLPPGVDPQFDAETTQPSFGPAETEGADLFKRTERRPDLPPARAGKKAFVLDPLLD